MTNGAAGDAGQTPRAKPESFRGRELSASLTVKDIRNSLAWYRDVVGFTVRKEFERDGVLRAVSLKAGAVAILITQDDGAKGLDRLKGDGFSLRITTAQNIDEVADRIKQRGGVLDSEPANATGMRVFLLRDPEPPAG
jgi:predicted enzyme related to lactoylglutathione lyase